MLWKSPVRSTWKKREKAKTHGIDLTVFFEGSADFHVKIRLAFAFVLLRLFVRLHCVADLGWERERHREEGGREGGRGGGGREGGRERASMSEREAKLTIYTSELNTAPRSRKAVNDTI